MGSTSWYQVFDNASVDSNLLFLQKVKNKQVLKGAVAKKDFQIEEIETYIEKYKAPILIKTDDFWSVSDSKVTSLKNKLYDKGKLLSKWNFQIYRGILSGFNDAFIIETKVKEELIQKDPKNAEIIKPLLRGRDIERYSYNSSNLWLLFTRRGIEIDAYPAIREYLLSYYDYLLPKNTAEQKIGRKPGSYKWFEIQDNIAYYKEFEKEKLVWAETMRVHKTGDRSFPRFGYDNGNYYADKTVFIGLGEHLKYLLAILNSKIGRYLIQLYVDKLDTGGYMMQKAFLNKIPIYYPSNNEDVPFVKLIDEILKSKETGSDTLLLEKQIDQLIYQLYNLTPEEIQTIESSIK